MTMQWTSEQLEQMRQAKERGERRVTVGFTQEQKEAYQQAVAQELAGKEENIAHFRKVQSAAEQSGFFGDVRRAILQVRPSIGDLAATIGVEPRLLSDFLAGEADLPSAALDRLIEALGLRLMQEIPR